MNFGIGEADHSGIYTIDELLNEIIKTENAMEIIWTELHVSTIALDLYTDVTVGKEFYDDMVSLVTLILSKIFPEENLFLHYIFRSQYQEEKSKVGLHHHIPLTSDVVMTTSAISTFVQILKETRYIYLNTIGVDCETKDVYDSNIYKKSRNNQPSHHSLRLPYQYKKNHDGLS